MPKPSVPFRELALPSLHEHWPPWQCCFNSLGQIWGRCSYLHEHLCQFFVPLCSSHRASSQKNKEHTCTGITFTNIGCSPVLRGRENSWQSSCFLHVPEKQWEGILVVLCASFSVSLASRPFHFSSVKATNCQWSKDRAGQPLRPLSGGKSRKASSWKPVHWVVWKCTWLVVQREDF